MRARRVAWERARDARSVAAAATRAPHDLGTATIDGVRSASNASSAPTGPLSFFNANIIDGARSGRWKYYRSAHLYTWPTPLDKKSTLAGRWAHANRYTDPQTGETVARSTHDPLLFDVVADRDESYNVVSRHPDVAARLHAAIEAWERAFFANPRGWR